MPLETLTTAPVLSDFTLLNEYNAQTPGTFFDGPAILHLHAPSATLKLPSPSGATHPDFAALVDPSTTTTPDQPLLRLPSIDIWITSRALLLWSPVRATGLQIPYPVITVTAQDRREVLLELNLSGPDAADEDLDFLQIRLVAGRVAHHAPAAASANGTSASEAVEEEEEASAKKVFRAISACQELNPDPPALGGEEGSEEEEGGFDPTAPGATGWITSENMAEFMDAEGNFRMPEGMTVVGGGDGNDDDDDDGGEEITRNGLGQGAGRRRTAAEVEGAETGVEGGEGEERKWQRTA